MTSKNWLVRYAYSQSYVPGRTNLCELFWMTVGVTVLYAFILGIVVGICILVYKAWLAVLVAIVFISAIATAVMWLDDEDFTPQWARDAWFVIKGRYCPVIEIEHVE